MREHIRAYMPKVPAGQTLGTFVCATRQFTCAHGVLGVHQYGFGFGLPKDCDGNTEIVVFVDRLSKMAYLAAVLDSIDGKGAAMLFIDRVFRQHGLPLAIIFDRDPRFTGKFWTSIFKVLGTRLNMSTADHPQTDGQTERVNRVIDDVLRSVR